jgi:hypothetical protein
MNSWQLQEAKARFSEFLDAALKKGSAGCDSPRRGRTCSDRRVAGRNSFVVKILTSKSQALEILPSVFVSPASVKGF